MVMTLEPKNSGGVTLRQYVSHPLAPLSLAQITTVLLLIDPNTDSIIWSRVLGGLSSKLNCNS
jgi:hypothetical protein